MIVEGSVLTEKNAGGLSRNVLKLIAITTIVIGHFFLYTFTAFRAFGLGVPWVGIVCMVCFVGPPIFFFFISEGFRYTGSKRKYALRLFIFSLITQICHAVTVKDGLAFDLHGFFFSWNVVFVLFLGFIDLCILESKWHIAIKISGVLATLVLSFLLQAEWFVTGKLIIISLYYLRKHNFIKFFVSMVLFYLTFVFAECGPETGFSATFWSKQYFYYLSFGIIGFVLVCFFYKGRNGKKSKIIQYAFYILYPLHLILIDLAVLIFGK